VQQERSARLVGYARHATLRRRRSGKPLSQIAATRLSLPSISVSLALAQTTLLLRDLLLQSLRRDPGWVLTGGTPRITSLPHGKSDKGIGDRLNLALISALPSAVVANAAAAMPSFDLRYLVTAHVFTTLRVELLLGMVL
jgi:hypothetical protein